MQITRNVKFAAYLRYKKIFTVKVEQISRGKGNYHYKMDALEWADLKAEFDKSEFLSYAQSLDAVQDLAY